AWGGKPGCFLELKDIGLTGSPGLDVPQTPNLFERRRAAHFLVDEHWTQVRSGKPATVLPIRNGGAVSLLTIVDSFRSSFTPQLRDYPLQRTSPPASSSAIVHLQRWLFRSAPAGLQRSSSFPSPGLATTRPR